jgi:isoleucyl-tRNA synthetase
MGLLDDVVRWCMPFQPVDPQVDFPAQERAILAFWRLTDAFENLRRLQQGKPKWSFLDGPITANNPMGVHHAWGRTYKDTYGRYFAMTGHQLRYQNGFDCQGLWVEVEVEKQLKLQSKRDIENLVPGDGFASIDRFVQLCKERVDTYARIQTEQSIRLGYWMDWDQGEDWNKPPDERHSYFTMSEVNNYTIWTFLKKCFDRGLVYRGYDAMPWCPRCAVGLSQQEMHEGYQLVAHRAVFVRLPLRNRKDESLLIWTTTPWTLTSNVAAAVNPQLTYLKVKHKDHFYYLAKGAYTAPRLEEEFRSKNKEKPTWIPGVPKLKTLEQIFKEKGGAEVVGELTGKDLVGWTYDGPFDDLPAQQHPGGYPEETAEAALKQGWTLPIPAREAHRVIVWDKVGETEGTGIVHIAPGCGKEDFELGKREELPPVAPLDEFGAFTAGLAWLAGKAAIDHTTTDEILAELQKRGILFAVEKYPHSYPHCWRCKTEVLYRLVDEWFINMKWREEIMRICGDITWIPDFGYQRELDWLRNMGDWMISKKRYWGLALPIWVDEQTRDFEVIGSRAELKARAVEGWEQFEGHSPHRPWIDLVKIRNPKTGNLMKRIGDVGNPWLDAGIVPYSTMGYDRDRTYWEKWFPADFIVESLPGQFRNWFYSMLAMSTMMEGRAPFKTLLGHGLVKDEKGDEMHKSKGNSIPFDEAADHMGADLMRWMFCRHNPVNNINFGYGPADELRARFLLKLWNTYKFFLEYAIPDQFDPHAEQVPVINRRDIDRWILSELQTLIGTARAAFERFDVQAFCLEAEKFVDDRLSNWYVRRNRRRFWKSEEGTDKQAAYQTLYTVLTTLAKLFAPVMPFLAEAMYQNLVIGVARQGESVPESVHHGDYPQVDPALKDEQLSGQMNALLDLITLGSAARNSVKLKVRQPLAQMHVLPGDEKARQAVLRFSDQIGDELNIKKVVLHDPTMGPLLQTVVRPNMKTLGPKYGPRLKAVQEAILRADPALLAKKAQSGEPFEIDCADGPATLDPCDVVVASQAPEGWAGVADGKTQVSLDTRITRELAQEGMARDVVRQIQELRKKANLEVTDRITLHLNTDSPELRSAIESHQQFIAHETLTKNWSKQALNGEGHKTSVKVEGQPLDIEIKKV